jgi:hypothetical protein
MRALSRRQLFRLAVALPCGALFNRFRALAAPHLNRVKITGIRAMAIRNIAGNSPLLAFPEWDGERYILQASGSSRNRFLNKR